MFKRAPREQAPVGHNIDSIRREVTQFEQTFLPSVEEVTMDSGLRLSAIVVPGTEGRYTWDTGKFSPIFAKAREKTGVSNAHLQTLNEKMQESGIENWEESLNGKVYFKTIFQTMQQEVIWGKLDAQTVDTFRKLPFTNTEIPMVQKKWLEFLMTGTSSLTPEALNRACQIYGNICTFVHNTDPAQNIPRAITDESDAPIKVSLHAQKIMDGMLARSQKGPLTKVDPQTGRKYVVTSHDIQMLRDMSFNGNKPDTSDPAMRARRALSALGERAPTPKQIVTATGVGAMGLGLVASPAAAETRMVEQVVPATDPTNMPAIHVKAPNIDSKSYAFVQTVAPKSSTGMTTGPALMVPLTHAPQPVAVHTMTGEVEFAQIVPEVVTPSLSQLGVEFEPVTASGLVSSAPIVSTAQGVAKETDTLAKFAQGGMTQTEQVMAASILGMDTGTIINPEQRESSPLDGQTSKETDPAIRTLSDTNVLLNTFVENTLATYTASVDINGTTESVVKGDSYRMALIYLRGAQNNLGTLAALKDSEKQQFINGLSPAQVAVVNGRAAEMFEQLKRGENGAGVGLNEAQQKDFAALLAIASLGAEIPDTAQQLLARAQAGINKAEADRAAEKAAEERATGENSSRSEARVTSLEKASQAQLLDLIKDTARQYGWSSEKSLFMQAAVLEGYPVAPSCLVCGAAGNAKVEGAGYQANVNEYGNGIGFGLYQWSFERRDRLEAAAREAGVDLSVNNLANYRFQVAYAKKEMQQRTLRGGGNGTEWDLFTRLKDPSEIAWQFQWHFERPAHESPQSQRTKEADAIWKQISGMWNAKQEAIRKAAEKKAAAESHRSGIWEGLPSADRQRLNHILNNVKRDGSQLLETYTASKVNILRDQGYKNGQLPSRLLERVDNSGHVMEKDAADAFKAMNADFRRDHPGHNLTIGGDTSAYRSYQEQVATKQSAISKGRGSFAAEPGTSKHGWGLAVDLGPVASSYDTIQYKWLVKNGYRYGFFHKVGHMENAATPEPWHWEYMI